MFVIMARKRQEADEFNPGLQAKETPQNECSCRRIFLFEIRTVIDLHSRGWENGGGSGVTHSLAFTSSTSALIECVDLGLTIF